MEASLSRITLELLGAGGVLFRRDLAAGPVRIGRHPDNEIALTDPEVSGQHALLALVGDRVVLTDLRSTNGTTVDGRAITRAEPLTGGEVIGLTDHTSLALTLRSDRPQSEPTLVLEDQTSGVLHTQLESPCWVAGHPVVVVGRQGGAVAYRLGEQSARVELNQTFTVVDRELRFTLSRVAATTRRAEDGAYPYVVTASLDGTFGPMARFEDLHQDRQHDLRAENRAVLIYLLAQGLHQAQAADQEAGGWCDDHKLRVGIWGASGNEQLQNNLNVLIGRTRKELASKGFDGACIQRIHGHTRLWVDRVTLPGLS